MMDPKLLQIKNEIQKRVQFFKIKKNNLPDFVRKKRDSILTKRLDQEKQASQALAQTMPDLSKDDKVMEAQLAHKMIQRHELQFKKYMKEVLTTQEKGNSKKSELPLPYEESKKDYP